MMYIYNEILKLIYNSFIDLLVVTSVSAKAGVWRRRENEKRKRRVALLIRSIDLSLSYDM